MATYSTQKLLDTSAAQIPQIAEAIRKDFADDGFEVYVDTLMSGGRDISITKGNLFKAVLGMRSALKISLTPRQSGVFFDANVGIYGQQAIPTIISMLVYIYNFIVYGGTAPITYSVSLSLFAVVMFASIFGTIVPMTFDKMKIDPAIATGPFITIISDIMGMLIYMVITVALT